MGRKSFILLVGVAAFLELADCEGRPRLEGKNERAFTRSFEDISEELGAEEFRELIDALDLFLRLPRVFLEAKDAKSNRNFSVPMVDGLTVPEAKRKVAEVLVEFADSRAEQMLTAHIEKSSKTTDEAIEKAINRFMRDLNIYAEYRAKREYAEHIISQARAVTLDNPRRVNGETYSFDVVNGANAPIAYMNLEFFVTAVQRTEPYAKVECELFVASGVNPGEKKTLQCSYRS